MLNIIVKYDIFTVDKLTDLGVFKKIDYYNQYLKEINPKLLITFNDNNYLFYKLNKKMFIVYLCKMALEAIIMIF